MKKLHIGDFVAARRLYSITQEEIQLPANDRLTHLQFRRFAGCPFCSLHLNEINKRHEELSQEGIRELVVFHSPAESLLSHTPDMPFAIIADPEENLYKEFGVSKSFKSILNPLAFISGLRAGLLRVKKVIPNKQDSILSLPADFLIAPSGEILALKYGRHAFDQWSVDEILTLAQNSNVLKSPGYLV